MRKIDKANIDYEVMTKPNGTGHQFKRNSAMVRLFVDEDYSMEVSPYQNNERQDKSNVTIKHNGETVFNGNIQHLCDKLT